MALGRRCSQGRRVPKRKTPAALIGRWVVIGFVAESGMRLQILEYSTYPTYMSGDACLGQMGKCDRTCTLEIIFYVCTWRVAKVSKCGAGTGTGVC